MATWWQSIMVFFKVNFLKNRVALQCVNFYCTEKKSQPHLYLYLYSLPFVFPSHLGHHSTLSRVPCGYSMFSLVIYFTHSISSVYMSIKIFQFIPPHPFSLGMHIFFFSMSVCIFALQIKTSIPFFWFPYI